MQWLIQNSGMTFDALDHNTEPLIKALDELGVEKHAIGYVPIEQKIVGLDGLDSSKPTIFYGSTKVAQLGANTIFKPGSFYEAIWFDPSYAAANRSDMLNTDIRAITTLELRNNWLSEPMFIKSVDPKILTGMILETDEKSMFLDEYSHVPDDAVLTLSPLHTITHEWRFFVVGGAVAAGSQYKHDGIKRIREAVPEDVWAIARQFAAGWLPSRNVVMDICRLTDGSYRIVEFNAINSSGFYNCNVSNIVTAINNLFA